MGKKAKQDKENWEGMFWDSHKYNERKQIKTGTYLHSFCPACQKEISNGSVLLFEVVNADGAIGRLELSPYLNVYEMRTDIKLPTGKAVADLRCPHCHKSLKVEGKSCGFGDPHVAGFLVGISNSKVPFYICMKLGCPWHAISPEDQNQIILDSSDEW